MGGAHKGEEPLKWESTQRGGVTQMFVAPKFLLAVEFYLLFIIDQQK